MGAFWICLTGFLVVAVFCKFKVEAVCSSTYCRNGGSCDDRSGSNVCTCPHGYEGKYCQEEINLCAGDPCENNGRCFWNPGEFFCYCTEGFVGETCRQELLIKDIHPLYGPVSGGTKLTILGERLGDFNSDRDNPVVRIGGLGCEILSRNETIIVVKTPPMSGPVVLAQKLDITLESVKRPAVTDVRTFTYKPDPRLTKVEPLEAIARGGIRLTVSGQFLNSVSQPLLTITRLITVGNKASEVEYTSPCLDVHSTRMICPTPQVDVPINHRTLSKRHVSSNQTVPRRGTTKREATSEELVFYLGFIQDGIENYRDLRESPISEQAFIDIIAEPPVITSWDGVKEHTPGDSLAILGEGMTYGCRVDDYTVSVGSGVCTSLSLTETAVYCSPPENEPPRTPNDDDSDSHRVYLSVGYYKTYVGQLSYKDKEPLEDPLVIAGICAGLFILLLIIIIPPCVIYCRKRRNKNKPSQQGSQQLEADGTVSTTGFNSPSLPLTPRRYPQGHAPPVYPPETDFNSNGKLHGNYLTTQGYERPAEPHRENMDPPYVNDEQSFDQQW